ncbi:hypothetical protein RBSWK_02598 [Rhodopirellula baltica SWK14]|uniref:Uncharacterized protein n=1 Tax=Rhodopirellula baltica SWK14 TaxID=993516 RepID=L7CIP4_RHOBT|nr:hypothetical protein RBSWK_02598 [Rhodopirellula baltica SWK14]
MFHFKPPDALLRSNAWFAAIVAHGTAAIVSDAAFVSHEHPAVSNYRIREQCEPSDHCSRLYTAIEHGD